MTNFSPRFVGLGALVALLLSGLGARAQEPPETIAPPSSNSANAASQETARPTPGASGDTDATRARAAANPRPSEGTDPATDSLSAPNGEQAEERDEVDGADRAPQPAEVVSAAGGEVPAEAATDSGEPPEDEKKNQTTPCRAEQGQPVGRVARIDDGVVVILKDPRAVINQGDRVGFRDSIGDERVVGKVVRVNNRTYHVRIQVNESVRVGEMGYRTPAEPTGSLVAPTRSHYRGAAGLSIKPWLGLDGDESGALFEGFVAWQLSERFRVRGAFEPASPALGEAPGALEAYVAPSVTFHIAEMGFGIGAGTANHNFPNPPGIGLLFTPILRVGAEDGLMFRARSSAVVHHQRAVFGSFRVDGAIPVAYGVRILAGGGGGDSGYYYGETGLEMLLVGNGLPGSWFGRGTFGYGGTSARTLGDDGRSQFVHANGPYMGLGVEHRF